MERIYPEELVAGLTWDRRAVLKAFDWWDPQGFISDTDRVEALRLAPEEEIRRLYELCRALDTGDVEAEEREELDHKVLHLLETILARLYASL